MSVSEGATLTYQQLFETYARMGVEYGIMIDVFRDPQATLESAKEALQCYEPFKGVFKLVGVAQGTSPKEYIENYEALKALGFSYIAIGGLLRKVEQTARYAQVRSEESMFELLQTLREKYPDDWLFVLGSFHPTRLEKLKELKVWGDYKGWIFQYKKRNETLNEYLSTFASNHLQHIDYADSQKATRRIATLQKKVALRDDLMAEQRKVSQLLVEGRRALKVSLVRLYQEVQVKAPVLAGKLSAWITHGLLDDSGEKLVIEALRNLDTYESHEAQSILDNIHNNRKWKMQVDSIEVQLNKMNISLAKNIAKLCAGEVQLIEDTEEFCNKIAELIESTERTHRFEQVRGKIALDILSRL
jgi:hypothetical protein